MNHASRTQLKCLYFSIIISSVFIVYTIYQKIGGLTAIQELFHLSTYFHRSGYYGDDRWVENDNSFQNNINYQNQMRKRKQDGDLNSPDKKFDNSDFLNNGNNFHLSHHHHEHNHEQEIGFVFHESELGSPEFVGRNRKDAKFFEFEEPNTFLGANFDEKSFSLQSLFTDGDYPERNIAIGLALTTRNELDMSEDTMVFRLPFFKGLLTSFCSTATSGFNYHFYIAHDDTDPFFSSSKMAHEQFGKAFYDQLERRCTRQLNTTLHMVECHHTGKPAWAQNDAMMAAYMDNMDYFYRVNDDTVMETTGWTEKFIDQLKRYNPENVGVVGPWFKEGNVVILTHDFVHRTHVDIFGFYYPRVFTDWFADDWITSVYWPERCRKVPGTRVKHTMEKGQRYIAHYEKAGKIKVESDIGKSIINRYINRKIKGQASTTWDRNMTWVISMSLDGKDFSKLYGSLRYAQLLPVLYPKWRLRVYVGYNYTNVKILSILVKKLENTGIEIVRVSNRTTHTFPSSFWRYLVIDDVKIERFLIRDSNTRPSERELAALEEWIKSTNTSTSSNLMDEGQNFDTLNEVKHTNTSSDIKNNVNNKKIATNKLNNNNNIYSRSNNNNKNNKMDSFSATNFQIPAFHCIRDHPNQAIRPLTPGLLGGINSQVKKLLGNEFKILKLARENDISNNEIDFLNKILWPKIQSLNDNKRNGILCHDSVSCSDWPSSFAYPALRVGGEYIGQKFDSNDQLMSYEDPYFWNSSYLQPNCVFVRNTGFADETVRVVISSQPVFWSQDYHITPVMDMRSLLEPIGVKIIDNSLSYYCEKIGTCARDLKVINSDNGMSLGEKLINKFYRAYINSTIMKKVSAFVCTLPVAMCELFMPFNKSIIIIATNRYEQARGEPREWSALNVVLDRISKHSTSVIAANNLYDAKYIEYFTGIKPTLLPHYCAYLSPTDTYKPTRKQFLVSPIHSTELYDLFFVEFDSAVMDKKLDLIAFPLREMYPQYLYSDLAAHRGIIYVPYQVSMVSLTEQYRMNIPLFVPSLDLLTRWNMKYQVVRQRTWSGYHGKRSQESSISGLFPKVPDPNNDLDEEAIRYWLKFSDFYQWPGIIYYESVEDLVDKMASLDLNIVSQKMAEYNIKVRKKIKLVWSNILSKVIPKNK